VRLARIRTDRIPMGAVAARALVRRALLDARVRTLAFGYLFAAIAYIQPEAYRHTYPTLRARLEFAHSFGGNSAVRLFYGEPFNLLSTGGYTAWRVGGTLAIFGAVFGLLAAVRALRSEEDAGRTEVVLASTVGRTLVMWAALGAVLISILLLWMLTLLGLLLAGLPVGASAYMALAAVSVVPVFAGVGALVSQLAPTRRITLELGGAVVALSLLLRVIADTSSGAAWLRWATPMGWAEELRPFTGAQPWVLVLPLALSVGLLWAALRLSLRRDIGTGMLSARDTVAPRLRLLGSPTAFALRAERFSLVVWGLSVAIFAYIVGVISNSVASAGISKSLQRELSKVGAVSIVKPSGYISFTFLFFVLVVSLFVVAQMGAARHEEAEERLETVLALPVARRSWLGGRLGLATGGALGISLIAGLVAWLGAVSAGVHLSLWRMLEAGLNCMPVALLFLGVGALVYAVLPRAAGGLAYGVVVVAFLWQLFGSLLGAPKWLVDATPFAHIGFVPAQAFRGGAALVMAGAGVALAFAAVWAFERRDLLGA
jgi:polyether ionophore transport system permease protein